MFTADHSASERLFRNSDHRWRFFSVNIRTGEGYLTIDIPLGSMVDYSSSPRVRFLWTKRGSVTNSVARSFAVFSPLRSHPACIISSANLFLLLTRIIQSHRFGMLNRSSPFCGIKKYILIYLRMYGRNPKLTEVFFAAYPMCAKWSLIKFGDWTGHD